MEHTPVTPENTSGQGRSAVVPPEIKRWNWAAFLVNWIWAVPMRVWIGLLAFVPYVCLIVVVLLGLKGNEWAWRKRKWQSVEQFKRVQRLWAYWILPIYLIQVALVFLVIRPLLVQAYFIPSEAMAPTLLVDDHLLANKLIYRFRAPRRGEIVIFKTPPAMREHPRNKDFIKRVIAIPGDTIQVKRGLLYVNGLPHDHMEVRQVFAGDSFDSRMRFYKDHIVIADGEKTKSLSIRDIATAFGKPGAAVTIRPGAVILNGRPLDQPYIAEDPDYELARRTVPPGRLFVMGDNINNSMDSQIWGFLPVELVKGKAWFRFSPSNRIGLIR